MISDANIYKVKLNPGKQEIFCSLPDSIFEGFYGGAAGGGKSYSLLVLPILREFYKVPTFHGLILRRTFPELNRYQIEEAHKIYPYFGGRWNEQKKRYTFESGAKIDFSHAEEEKDVRKYDSAQFQYIAFDELTSFTEFQYRFMLARCRTVDRRLPTIIRSASNPGNIGHGWVRDRFVQPNKIGNVIIKDKTTGLLRIFIQAFASDNPVLLEATPMYLKQMELLPEAEKRAKLYGDWWSFSGQVFREFRQEKFPDEPENAFHLLDCDYPIPEWTPKILAIDWGYAAMTYALWGAAFPNRRLIAYDEYSETGKDVDEWALDISRKSLGENYPTVITLDPSAWQHRDKPLSIADQFILAWKAIHGKNPPLIKADNERVSGKILVHSFLRWQKLGKVELGIGTYDKDVYETILRLRGLETAKQYLKQFLPQERKEEVLPRLLIKKNCAKLINTIPLCVYQDATKDGKLVEDVKEFAGDDPYDTLRYFLKASNNYFEASNQNETEAKLMQEKSLITQQLQNTGDMTSFYRKMEKLENKKGPVPLNIKRGGARRIIYGR